MEEGKILIQNTLDQVSKEYPEIPERLKQYGKRNFDFVVGQIMHRTQGRFQPKLVKKIVQTYYNYYLNVYKTTM